MSVLPRRRRDPTLYCGSWSARSRPWLHWLLWLVIALLPLRGWALAQMAAPVADGATPAVLLQIDTTTDAAADTDLHDDMTSLATTPDRPARTPPARCAASAMPAWRRPPALALALPELLTHRPAAAPAGRAARGPRPSCSAHPAPDPLRLSYHRPRRVRTPRRRRPLSRPS